MLKVPESSNIERSTSNIESFPDLDIGYSLLIIGHLAHNTLDLLLIGGRFQGAWLKKDDVAYLFAYPVSNTTA